jgi:hypothetical protein
MKILNRCLASLCLAACALAAQAEPLNVTLSADFQLPPLSPAPGTLSVAFTVTEPLAGVVPQGDFAFVLSNLALDVVFNGSAAASLTNSVAWFDYADQNYYGIDIRMSNLLVPGDVMQLILAAPVGLYSGGAAAPTLERLTLTDLFGSICYYGTGSGACTAEGPMSNGIYSVTAVPEASSLAMLLAGLGTLGALGRRRRRGA